MVLISKCRGTTRYLYGTFIESKYRVTTGWLIFNVNLGWRCWFVHQIFYTATLIIFFLIQSCNTSVEYRTQFSHRKVSEKSWYRPGSKRTYSNCIACGACISAGRVTSSVISRCCLAADQGRGVPARHRGVRAVRAARVAPLRRRARRQLARPAPPARRPPPPDAPPRRAPPPDRPAGAHVRPRQLAARQRAPPGGVDREACRPRARRHHQLGEGVPRCVMTRSDDLQRHLVAGRRTQ